MNELKTEYSTVSFYPEADRRIYRCIDFDGTLLGYTDGSALIYEGGTPVNAAEHREIAEFMESLNPGEQTT